MAKLTRRQLLASTAGVLLLSVSRVSAGKNNAFTEFVAFRLWPANEYTRITIESTLPLKYQYFHLKNPDRLVLDIKDAQLNEILKAIPSKVLARDPYIVQARVGQYTADTVRVVFDLKVLVNPQVFSLSPVADFKNRLVIDLYPVVIGGDDDPLMALLQDYSKGKISTDGSSPMIVATSSDPLADIISGIMKDADKIADNKPNKPADNRADKKPDSKPTTQQTSKKKQYRIMLDPGHGGEDPGAIGKSGLKEKDVVLAISRLAKKDLERLGFQVYMTRNEDIFIPLRVRVAKARKLKCDLFISVHADAFTNQQARGTGVYALSTKGATSEAARYLAKTQNLSDEIGGVVSIGNPTVDKTLFDLQQTYTIQNSLTLGKFVLKELGKINKLHKGYVDQAAFAVLKAPEIPSILVESAFISNPTELKLLSSLEFRKKTAQAIANGVKSHLK